MTCKSADVAHVSQATVLNDTTVSKQANIQYMSCFDPRFPGGVSAGFYPGNHQQKASGRRPSLADVDDFQIRIQPKPGPEALGPVDKTRTRTERHERPDLGPHCVGRGLAREALPGRISGFRARFRQDALGAGQT